MDGPCERQAPRRPASGLETLDASPKQVTDNDRARSDGPKNKTGIGVTLRDQSLCRLAIQIRRSARSGVDQCGRLGSARLGDLYGAFTALLWRLVRLGTASTLAGY